jgi:hypothetical protein
MKSVCFRQNVDTFQNIFIVRREVGNNAVITTYKPINMNTAQLHEREQVFDVFEL